MQVFMLKDESGAWTSYNDCVHASGNANITQYSGVLLDGGGFEVTSGILKDYATGTPTLVTATLAASNVSSSLSSLPNVGTEANTIFGFFPDFGPSASYNSSSFGWYYKVTFTGLDPSKTYTFVTSANRNSSSYAGTGPASRWTRFYITGADLYTNASTPGVVEIAPSIVEMNTGYNTVNGYVVRWTGIKSSTGSFTVVSENVGAELPTPTFAMTWGRVKALYAK
ncbi:MAG: hypothetical protein A2W00_00250 [Candidatus Eisenbacteria bacterium RBG_16_71_46]|nr:MAG: hypothetical protein A2W00_00250 [Candidatus Eisenbacteria bacterium RBG_16_71_46]OGF20966.1 MAG: hypothetical protein A2V63_11395 [Candidatus Eisenbacteria bacterium RBG_19FT_COMBO_70_11]